MNNCPRNPMTSIADDIARTPLVPARMVCSKRRITGMSAVLLPFDEHGQVDWAGFEGHLLRTLAAGLVPAVNMDTGYVNLISREVQIEALSRTRRLAADAHYVAGAFVADRPGDRFDPDACRSVIADILRHDGVPVIMQSHGLSSLPEAEIINAYRAITADAPEFIAFELGTVFAPFGRIYELSTYEQLMQLDKCIGAKHSSLSRELEWQRLLLRDRVRPGFKVLTGNDLAIDMVMYGSDYLLGLSTMAPDLFALRDRLWEQGDPRFYELNDLLQYLGMFTFRPPVPAYKHSAAQILKLQGWIIDDATAPGSLRRPAEDVLILKEITARMDQWRKSMLPSKE